MAGKRVAPPEVRWASETKKSSTTKQNEGKKGGGLAVLLTVVLLLGALFAGFCAYTASLDTILPGVTVSGTIDLGGLTKAQAREKLEQELPALLRASRRTLTLDGEELGSWTMEELGFSADSAALADAAWNTGREGGFMGNALAYLKALTGGGADLLAETSWDSAPAQAIVERLAEKVDRPGADAFYELTEQGLFVTKETDGLALDQGQALYLLGQYTLGEQTTGEVTVTSSPGKELDVEALAARLNAEATETRYDAATGTVVEGTVGVALDAEAARYVLEAAAPGTRVQLPAQVVYPEMTKAELEAVLFRDVLGTATTNVSGSSARRGNVKLAGEAVNGTILNPGDIFDYNKVVGERTAERGYGAAATYVNGETVDTIGGGICQVSSTVYLASLLSNLEIVERYAHRYWPGYIELGMDATVSWGGPEFRFKNNTDYPIRIDVEYKNSKLTVTFHGTKTDDTYVKMTREVLSSSGYETEYVETEELPWGQEKQKQNGYTAYKVESYRCVYDGQGNLISKTLEAKSDYKSRNEIILVGIAGKPQEQPPADTGTTDEPTPPLEDTSDEEMPEWLRPSN